MRSEVRDEAAEVDEENYGPQPLSRLEVRILTAEHSFILHSKQKQYQWSGFKFIEVLLKIIYFSFFYHRMLKAGNYTLVGLSR